MAYYLQRERFVSTPLRGNEIVNFELEIACSQTITEIPSTEPDFVYYYDGEWPGSIEILKRGQYLIYWQLAPILDEPRVSEVFQLRQLTYNPVTGWQWQPVTGTSTQLNPVGTNGFAVINHQTQGALTIALWQSSSAVLQLSNQSEECLKGRILIYGLSELDGDLSSILERIKYLEENCCLFDLDDLERRVELLRIGNINQDERISNLQMDFGDFKKEYDYLIEHSQVIPYSSSVFSGIRGYAIQTGHIYHFHGEGTLTTQVTLPSGSVSQPGSWRHILPRNSFSVVVNGEIHFPFDYYSGSAVKVGWVFNKVGNNCNLMNLYGNNTGLFMFANSSTSINAGTDLEFTFHIVLPLPI